MDQRASQVVMEQREASLRAGWNQVLNIDSDYPEGRWQGRFGSTYEDGMEMDVCVS